MLRGITGEGSIASVLRTGLNDSYRRLTGIGHRIANATTPGFQDYPAVTENGFPQRQPVNMEQEMAALADEQIRFEATARILRMNYDMIRVTMRQG